MVPRTAQLWELLPKGFATLHPEHVGRFVLDGVVDAEDYFTGGWRENLLQADECVRSFSKFCFDAKEYVESLLLGTNKLDA